MSDSTSKSEAVAPYAYIYEYDTGFGLHRQLEPGTFNGAKPTGRLNSASPLRKTQGAHMKHHGFYRAPRTGSFSLPLAIH